MEIVYPSIGISFLFLFLGIVAYALSLDKFFGDLFFKPLMLVSVIMSLFFFEDYEKNWLIIFSPLFYIFCFFVGFYLAKKLDEFTDRFLFPE